MRELVKATLIRNVSSAKVRAKVNYTGRANPRYVENIVTTYLRIPREKAAFDAKWYWRARTWCEKTAIDQKVDVSTVAGVLAALSPACSWERNKLDTVAVITRKKQHKVTTYKRNVEKAKAILKGERVEFTLAPKPRRSGMKCLTFYRTIMEPWRAEGVIDRHALAVAHGSKFEKGVTYRRYHDFARSYRVAAGIVGIGVNELQAATWVSWRERKVTQ